MARLAAVVLAAGASRRFGERNKLLAPIAGTALVRRAVAAMLVADPHEVVVVTGHEPDEIKAALDGLPVRFVHNGDWRAGLGASIAAGVAALLPETEGAFIVPGDMPFLDPRTILGLATAFAGASPSPIVYPVTAAGEQRNPVLWPRRRFAALMGLPASDGAKALLQTLARESVAVPVESEAMFADIDTQADLAEAAAAAGETGQ